MKLYLNYVHYFLLAFVLAALFSSFAFAQLTVPEVDAWEKLAELVLNWNSLGTVAKGSLFVLVATQLVKQSSDFKHKRLVVVVLSIAYGIFEKMAGDMSLLGASAAVLFSGMGAVMLYEALKPVLRQMPMFDFLKLSKND